MNFLNQTIIDFRVKMKNEKHNFVIFFDMK